MNLYYSPTTGGFYDPTIHGARTLSTLDPNDEAGAPVDVPNPACLIPADAVEITPEQHAALLDGQSAGQRIVAGPGGFPELADPAPPTPEDVARVRVAEARAYLASTDWMVIRAMEVGGKAVPSDVTSRRASARIAAGG